MKKIKYLLILVCLMLLPSVVNAYTEVSTEEELRSAINQGGDIVLKKYITITDTLTIDKDVNISGSERYFGLFMRNDEPLTINSGNVTFTNIYIGCLDKEQGVVVNGGNVTFSSIDFQMLSDQEIIVNKGMVNIINSHGRANESTIKNILVINDGIANIENSYLSSAEDTLKINGGKVSIDSSYYATDEGTEIESKNNAIYLNGGSISLNGGLEFDVAQNYYSIYINKLSEDETLTFDEGFAYSYSLEGNSNFSIYVNPEINNLKITDKKGWLSLNNNKIQMNFCSGGYYPILTANETDDQICKNLNNYLTYDGPIYTNELKDCTNIYINDKKHTVNENNCKNETNNKEITSQTVVVPSTKASAIIYTTIGICLFIIAGTVISILIKDSKKH